MNRLDSSPPQYRLHSSYQYHYQCFTTTSAPRDSTSQHVTLSVRGSTSSSSTSSSTCSTSTSTTSTSTTSTSSTSSSRSTSACGEVRLAYNDYVVV